MGDKTARCEIIYLNSNFPPRVSGFPKGALGEVFHDSSGGVEFSPSCTSSATYENHHPRAALTTPRRAEYVIHRYDIAICVTGNVNQLRCRALKVEIGQIVSVFCYTAMRLYSVSVALLGKGAGLRRNSI